MFSVLFLTSASLVNPVSALDWTDAKICQAAVYAYAAMAVEPQQLSSDATGYRIKDNDGVIYRCSVVDNVAILSWMSRDGLGNSDPLPFRSWGSDIVIRTPFGDQHFVMQRERIVSADRL